MLSLVQTFEQILKHTQYNIQGHTESYLTSLSITEKQLLDHTNHIFPYNKQ